MKLRNKKTGLTGKLINIYLGIYEDNLEIDISILLDNSGGECIDKQFNSIDELKKFFEDWEDYKPAEPFIKDEKIRKAVRAWAEANDIEDGITYLDNGEFRSYLNTTIDFAILVDEHRFDLLKKSEEYTITELCGKEKECER